MRRNARLLLGFLSALPLAALVLVVAGLMTATPFLPWEARHRLIDVLYWAIIVVTACIAPFLIGYLYHLHRINPMPASDKKKWEKYLLFYGWVSIPVYWYRYIWRDAMGGTPGLTDLSPNARWVVGIATLLAMAYVPFFFLSTILIVAAPGAPGGNLLATSLMIVHPLLAAFFLGLLLFYILHLYENPQIPESRKTRWLGLLLLATPIAMPVYWWKYVRVRDEK